jgi:hypothetical protein
MSFVGLCLEEEKMVKWALYPNEDKKNKNKIEQERPRRTESGYRTNYRKGLQRTQNNRSTLRCFI